MISMDSRPKAAQYHAFFVKMLPQIQRAAGYCFRKVPRALREDLIAETVATAYVNFARLAERNKLDVAFPTPLARFACKMVRAGRRIGNRPDNHDLLSQRAQKQGVTVQGLLELDAKGKWQELLIEDRRTRPADVATCRVDFRAWLATLTLRDRQIAEALAVGGSPTEVSKRFRISPGRVCQLRHELFEQWQQFHGEVSSEAA